MPSTTNSDSEDDLDYVPPADEYDSESSDDHSELETEAGSLPGGPLTDPAEQKKQRDALWANFQASVATPASNGKRDGNGNERGVPSAPPTHVKHVKIERTYLFAGKHVTEVVEVPEDSEDAKKWPRWPPRTPISDTASALPSENEKEGQQEEIKREGEDDCPKPHSAVLNPPPSTVASTPGPKRPGPRKPRTPLPSIPKASQAKKITTLDKCAMDWRAHVASQSSDVKNELDVNRRGGGYLEKVEFLKRVEDRREDAFEASKANKRRKT